MARLYTCVPYNRRNEFDRLRIDYEQALAGSPPTDRGDGVPGVVEVERTCLARKVAARMLQEAEYWARRALTRAPPGKGADWLTVQTHARSLAEALAALDAALADCEAASRLMS